MNPRTRDRNLRLDSEQLGCQLLLKGTRQSTPTCKWQH